MWWNFPLWNRTKPSLHDVFGGNIDFMFLFLFSFFGLEAPMKVEIMMVGK